MVHREWTQTLPVGAQVGWEEKLRRLKFCIEYKGKKKIREFAWEFSDSRPGFPETILFLEDFQNPNGESTQKSDLAEPALTMLLDKMIFIDPFQPKWFYCSLWKKLQ